MAKKQLLVFTVAVIALMVFNNNCSSCNTKEELPNQSDTLISPPQTYVEKSIVDCEAIQAQIEKYQKIYQKAKEGSGSVLDESEAQIAGEEILKHSKKLLVQSKESLKNPSNIRQVSGSMQTFRDYQIYAQKMIEQFKEFEK